MHLTLYRDRCFHQLSACEECFSDFLRTGEKPPRGCLGDWIDDGAPELVIKVISGDHAGTLIVTERNRDRIMYEGWTKFVRLTPRVANPVGSAANETNKHDKSETS